MRIVVEKPKQYMGIQEQVQSMYGLATVMPERLTNPLVLTAIMAGWIVTPFLIARWRFK